MLVKLKRFAPVAALLYIFNPVDEFVALGGLRATFKDGADNQTYITTDGDRFRQAVAEYFANPTPLP